MPPSPPTGSDDRNGEVVKLAVNFMYALYLSFGFLNSDHPDMPAENRIGQVDRNLRNLGSLSAKHTSQVPHARSLSSV